jgi:hypothetical protein
MLDFLVAPCSFVTLLGLLGSRFRLGLGNFCDWFLGFNDLLWEDLGLRVGLEREGKALGLNFYWGNCYWSPLVKLRWYLVSVLGIPKVEWILGHFIYCYANFEMLKYAVNISIKILVFFV